MYKQLLKLVLITTIVVHFIFFGSCVATVVFAWDMFPWYVYLVLVMMIGRVMYSRDRCPLTDLETKLREMLRFTENKTFVKSWILNFRLTFKQLYFDLTNK